MHRFTFLKLLCASLSFAAATAQADFDAKLKELNKAPFPKVFRSVLDNEPRQLTYHIAPKVALSYSLWHCHLSALWSVENGKPVTFGGSVYDQIHGPQSKRAGNIIARNTTSEFSSSAGNVSYHSYTYLDENLTIRYAIKDAKGKTLGLISDSPALSGKALVRTLSVEPAALGAKVTFTPQGNFTWSTASGNPKPLEKPFNLSMVRKIATNAL